MGGKEQYLILCLGDIAWKLYKALGPKALKVLTKDERDLLVRFDRSTKVK